MQTTTSRGYHGRRKRFNEFFKKNKGFLGALVIVGLSAPLTKIKSEINPLYQTDRIAIGLAKKTISFYGYKAAQLRELPLLGKNALMERLNAGTNHCLTISELEEIVRADELTRFGKQDFNNPQRYTEAYFRGFLRTETPQEREACGGQPAPRNERSKRLVVVSVETSNGKLAEKLRVAVDDPKQLVKIIKENEKLFKLITRKRNGEYYAVLAKLSGAIEGVSPEEYAQLVVSEYVGGTHEIYGSIDFSILTTKDLFKFYREHVMPFFTFGEIVQGHTHQDGTSPSSTDIENSRREGQMVLAYDTNANVTSWNAFGVVHGDVVLFLENQRYLHNNLPGDFKDGLLPERNHGVVIKGRNGLNNGEPYTVVRDD
ncbi:MAG: hypothetical protein AABW49_02925 [Nanoarchaeota archaeon]